MARILVVDDSTELLEVYAAVLEREGHTVEIAETGDEALAKAQSQRPDLVLTDIFMAGMSGLTLITRLRSDLPAPAPPIIACSGFREVQSEALRRGAGRFLLKPVDFDDLIWAVHETLEGRPPVAEEAARSADRHRAVQAAREEVASSVLRAVLLEDPLFPRRLSVALRWLSGYLGEVSVLLITKNAREYEIFASSDETGYPTGPLQRILPTLPGQVVGGLSSLILPDLEKVDVFPGLRKAGIAFLVCLPVAVGGRSLAALCLVARTPREIIAAELKVLEYLCRRLSGALGEGWGDPFIARSGLIARRGFELLIDHQLHACRHRRGGLGLAVLEAQGLPRDGSASGLLVEERRANFALGELGASQVGVLLGGTAKGAPELGELVGRAKRFFQSGRVSSLRFEHPVPELDGATLLSWIEAQFTRGVEDSKVEVRQGAPPA